MKKIVLAGIAVLMSIAIANCKPKANEEPVITREPVKVEVETVTEAVTQPASTTVHKVHKRFATPLGEYMDNYIESIAREYGLEYELVVAVIYTESRYEVEKIGDNGASIGLMQIQPRYWQALADSLGVSIYKPVGNIVTGCAILNQLSQKYDGNIEKVLKAYNSGNPDYPDNSYVNKVLDYYKEIKNND